jgi:pyocin large subunit-like protein
VGAGGPDSGFGASAVETVHRAAPAPDANAQALGAGFRSRERLKEHFAKHGREFGGIPIAEYLARARRLRDAPVGGAILELRRPRGFARFDRATGAFGAYDDDGTIRTFFRPRDGESYFRRQAQRYGD